MDVRIALEWDHEAGISISKMDPFRDGIENALREKNYGSTLSQMWVVLTCRPYDFKQRKRFKKDIGRLEYDVILDYYLVKNVSIEEKKSIIKRQVVEITEQTFSKYKFADFDTPAFLADFRNIVESLQW